MKQKTYYLLYKITNLLNGMIYIGVHKTTNKKDNYFGSGKMLLKAVKKHGKNNFKKTILKEVNSQKELFKLEKEIVNESFVKRKDTYNLKIGGKGGFNNKEKTTVKDSNGNCFNVSIKDPRYISGELVGCSKGLITVKNKKSNYLSVSINDSRYLNGELVPHLKGLVTVKNSKGKIFSVSTKDPRYLNGKLKFIQEGKIVVKDLKGNTLQVNKNDKRIGKTLFFHWTGKKHSEKSKAKMRLTLSKKDLTGKNCGAYGTMWITNGKENKKIKKEDKIPKGFRKGRIMKF